MSETGLSEGYVIRIYWNGEGPLWWSVDRGDSSTEVNVTEIVIEGVALSTNMNPAADNETSPRAWLEGDARVYIAHTVAYVCPL